MNLQEEKACNIMTCVRGNFILLPQRDLNNLLGLTTISICFSLKYSMTIKYNFQDNIDI